MTDPRALKYKENGTDRQLKVQNQISFLNSSFFRLTSTSYSKDVQAIGGLVASQENIGQTKLARSPEGTASTIRL
jgi:hypothetical protein